MAVERYGPKEKAMTADRYGWELWPQKATFESYDWRKLRPG